MNGICFFLLSVSNKPYANSELHNSSLEMIKKKKAHWSRGLSFSLLNLLFIYLTKPTFIMYPACLEIQRFVFFFEKRHPSFLWDQENSKWCGVIDFCAELLTLQQLQLCTGYHSFFLFLFAFPMKTVFFIFTSVLHIFPTNWFIHLLVYLLVVCVCELVSFWRRYWRNEQFTSIHGTE